MSFQLLEVIGTGAWCVRAFVSENEVAGVTDVFQVVRTKHYADGSSALEFLLDKKTGLPLQSESYADMHDAAVEVNTGKLSPAKLFAAQPMESLSVEVQAAHAVERA